METITLIPTSEEYSEQGGADHRIAVKLDGPRSVVRSNLLNGARSVNVGWQCNPEEFAYLQLRARQNTARGGPPFTMQLVLNTPVPEMYMVKFVPGTFKLTSISGNTLNVSARIWAMPTSIDQPAPSNDSAVTYPEAP